MPVYLPPISRRRFIRDSLAAVAVLAAGGVTASTFAASDSQSWALLSDIHISADPNVVHSSVNMTHNLRAVAQEVVSWPEPISGVLVNGDLAYNAGEAEDYRAVLGLLRPMREHGLPIHLSLGNHDHREHFWSTLPEDKSDDPKLPERQTAIVRTKYANWFMLDSLIKTHTTAGQLGDEQRAWLARALDENTDKPALIAIHHNPNHHIEVGALQDTAALLEILRPRRHVKAWFFGHTHRWHVSQDESGLWLVNFPPVAYLFEEGMPNGWVHATLRPDSALLQLRCLNQKHKEHGQFVPLEWRV